VTSPEVIAIFGPTASGKSGVAEALADRLRTEVVSCDAMQVYSGLPILTNQPRRPTRLVGICSLATEMSVGAYAPLARQAIDELVDRAGVAIVAGGTGLYLRAAIAELELPPKPALDVRRRAEAAYDSDPALAHAQLRELDPAAADVVHRNDRRRVVRALELAQSGSSLVPTEDRLWSGATRRPTLIVGLDVPPAELARRIRARAETMFAAGVVDEVRRALEGPVSRTAEKALGLREIVDLPELEARERIVVRTRRYAAYQRKWMRRIPGLLGVDATRTPDEVAAEIFDRFGRHVPK
jgi:tRNA dimethylallyltransferase